METYWLRCYSEVLDEVHTALHHHDILSVRFSWIKYISDWTLSLSGTGYFAAISILLVMVIGHLTLCVMLVLDRRYLKNV